MADFHPIAYAEEHPYIAGAVVFGGGLVLLWALGYLGGGSSTTSSADAATQSMAAAYYAAEAAQTQAGTALNIATVQANAQTQGALIQAQGAVAINQSNNTAATSIASSMYNADMQDTASANAAATQQAQYAAQTAQVQANDAMNTANLQALYNKQTAIAGDNAQSLQTAMNTIIPQELALTSGTSFNMGIGNQQFSVGSFAPPKGTPAYGVYAGYPYAQALAMATAG